jgi:hypothetical protein
VSPPLNFIWNKFSLSLFFSKSQERLCEHHFNPVQRVSLVKVQQKQIHIVVVGFIFTIGTWPTDFSYERRSVKEVAWHLFRKMCCPIVHNVDLESVSAEGTQFTSRPDDLRPLTVSLDQRDRGQDPGQHVVFFIHGYNTQRDSALRTFMRMIDGMNGIEVAGAPRLVTYVCVRWNSFCNAWGPIGYILQKLALVLPPASLFFYGADLLRTWCNYNKFNRLVNSVARSGRKVHIIGHSMGCRTIMSYLTHAADVFKMYTMAGSAYTQEQQNNAR